MQDVIAAKRDGKANTAEQLAFLAAGAADNTLPDDQLSAWLMAAYINGMRAQETADLTLSMAASGERIDLTGLPKPWVDKHSTGGVGDKTTIVLLPWLAACGLSVVKMSGRGLGVTGGTIDKLGSVPGFRLKLSPQEVKDQAIRIGLALTGQSPQLAPADKRLYALRDSIGAVESLPLIVSSILSKKLAGGANNVVMDVKCGSGAFMQTMEDAKALAASLEEIGKLDGLNITASISDMSQPLGVAVGNAIEVKEAIRVLKGEQGRVADLCCHYVIATLDLVGIKDAEKVADEAMSSGRVLTKAKEWFLAQGADASVFESEEWMVAPSVTEVTSPSNGYISVADARKIGMLAIRMGAGRSHKDQEIDGRVGIELLVEVGDQVAKGDVIGRLHLGEKMSEADCTTKLLEALEFSDTPVSPIPVILQP